MTERPACWLAQFSPTSCSGRLTKAHLVKQQTIRREVWNRREDVKAARMQLGYDPFPSRLYDLLWDERVWRWACEHHHGMLDVSRKLRIPRERLPASVESYCEEYGLVWVLEREYGALEGAAVALTDPATNISA